MFLQVSLSICPLKGGGVMMSLPVSSHVLSEMEVGGGCNSIIPLTGMLVNGHLTLLVDQ